MTQDHGSPTERPDARARITAEISRGVPPVRARAFEQRAGVYDRWAHARLIDPELANAMLCPDIEASGSPPGH